jgi:glycosyltransferase involved in cell wall biosynthesis
MIKKVIQRLKELIRQNARTWSESYLRLRIMCPVKMPTNEARTISVAIPFFNNAKMAHVALFNILNDPRIAEIIMVDDGSDRDAFQQLKRKVKPFARKVKLFRRDVNLGAFANKIQAVELCSSDWVILLDYDNTLLPQYLDSIFNLDQWEDTTIYCSGYAYPHFNFRKELGGKVIDLDLASAMAKSKILNRPFFNDGNYFLPRNRFLQCVKPFWTYSVSASDVIFANYLWLFANNTLTVLEDSKYLHRVHDESTWLNNSEKSLQVIQPILKRIENKVSPYDCIDHDFGQISKEWIEPTLVSYR